MLFSIKNLKCSYGNGDVVLSVPDLDIEAGQILMVLGKSGHGKSTLLETLALMNNTIREGKVWFAPISHAGKVKYELNQIWHEQSKELLSEIRATHFSFIFQQTNLMPNFTVYENIYITRMIQGVSEADCHAETENLLNRIGLGGVEANRKVTELSGGQRQRVAFARAVISSFDVLFGDEPTGNLDEVNARELLSLLRNYIHEKDQPLPKTAIIVTHTIEMALEYADSIVVISKDSENGSGTINPSDFYRKDTDDDGIGWFNGHQRLTNEKFRTFLYHQFMSNQ